ncbi:LysR family transcriptional regulator, partial [Duganella vulcania]|uniref:LysR family transcriptional regulator n=1 Tax=Duganella vulcania TaxID=2692166 RepID=UPI0020C512FA
MRRITFDLDVLRTFVTGVDLGSFAKAADRLGRSTSAVSAQLKKLEDQLGMPVLRKEGRGMVTTSAGEALLGYARRLLELNDEAATAVRGAELAGSVRLGMQEDFGEHTLTEVLGRFARVHPKLRIEACVARNADLMAQMAADEPFMLDRGGDVAGNCVAISVALGGCRVLK